MSAAKEHVLMMSIQQGTNAYSTQMLTKYTFPM